MLVTAVETTGELQLTLEDYLFTFGLVGFALVVIYLTWKLSNRPPLTYHVHLIQAYRLDEQQQIVELINVNPESWQADELASLITDERTYPVSHTDIGEQRRVTPRVRALVVHSPAYVRADQSQRFEPGITQIYLPLILERHIALIYQALQAYTDQAIAGAVVISLYRGVARRLSNQNNLFISQLLLEVGTTEVNADVTLSSSSSEESELTSTITSSPDSSLASTDAAVDLSTAPQTSTSEQSTSTAAAMSESTGAEERLNNNVEPDVAMSSASSSDGVNIKLKFLDDTERIVQASPQTTILNFKRSHFPDQVANSKVIRLIFKGQLMRSDDRSLDSYGVGEQSVIHCHISAQPAPPAGAAAGVDGTSSDGGYNSMRSPQRPSFGALANETWPMRLLRYADAIPLLLFYALTTCVNWLREVENVRDDEHTPWITRQINQGRRGLLAILCVFVDFSTNQQNANVDEMFGTRYNFGMLFTLLFTLKFMGLWFLVLYNPQIADAKGVFILMILTIFFGLYTFHNRTRIARPEVGAASAPRFVH